MAGHNKLELLAQKLEAGQKEFFAKYGIPVVTSHVGSASCVYFSETERSDWWDILEHHDAGFDAKYCRVLIERGIYHFPVIVKQGSI